LRGNVVRVLALTDTRNQEGRTSRNYPNSINSALSTALCNGYNQPSEYANRVAKE